VAPRPQVLWHSEVDGAAEREFKVRCVQRLRLAPDIRRAYLVQATLIGATEPAVVLALATAEPPAEGLLQDLGDLATEQLAVEPRVAVITVRPGECAPIERVCTAFYYSV
jgi:hypothetical protein